MIARFFLIVTVTATVLGCGSSEGGGDTSPDSVFGPWDTTGPGVDQLGNELPDSGSPEDALPSTCVPGETHCVSLTAEAACAEDGSAWVQSSCAEGLACEEGSCAPVICTPGEPKGTCFGPSTYGVCSFGGTRWDQAVCPGGQTCYEGNCVDYKCPPGEVVCLGMTAVGECQQTLTGSYDWVTIESCEGGMCQNGKCLNACEVNIKDMSYLGCSYWALDLANLEGGGLELVAVVVSAPANGKDVNVTITDWSTQPPTPLTPAELGVSDMKVYKGDLKVFMLPAGHDIPASSLGRFSFKVETDQPVTVHQFNPLNGEDVYTNDASLLLPDTSGGKEHIVMSWPVAVDDDDAMGYFTLVATQPGQTTVQIWNSQDVMAGDGLSALSSSPGQLPHEFTLEQGQVLSMAALAKKGADLTGSRVVSDKKISVFGGHSCANVPALPSYVNYCDHVEQQLFPLEAWGDSYVADMFKPRNSAAKDTWRILAGADGVNVTLTPAVAGPFNGMTKGQFVEFNASGSFEVNATGPILVGHFMQGSNYPGYTNDPDCSDFFSGTGIGDPAFTLVVPTKQYLNEYVFLTPGEYRDDYVNIVAQSGTQILVDGAPPTGLFQQIPGSDMSLLQLKVSDGVHKVTGDKPFGLTVYGYDCDVSYAYPGGLLLK